MWAVCPSCSLSNALCNRGHWSWDWYHRCASRCKKEGAAIISKHTVRCRGPMRLAEERPYLRGAWFESAPELSARRLLPACESSSEVAKVAPPPHVQLSRSQSHGGNLVGVLFLGPPARRTAARLAQAPSQACWRGALDPNRTFEGKMRISDLAAVLTVVFEPTRGAAHSNCFHCT